jgi:hypothetical protein
MALVDVGDCDSVSDPDEAGAFMAWDYLWCGVRVVDYLPEAGFGLRIS